MYITMCCYGRPDRLWDTSIQVHVYPVCQHVLLCEILAYMYMYTLFISKCCYGRPDRLWDTCIQVHVYPVCQQVLCSEGQTVRYLHTGTCIPCLSASVMFGRTDWDTCIQVHVYPVCQQVLCSEGQTVRYLHTGTCIPCLSASVVAVICSSQVIVLGMTCQTLQLGYNINHRWLSIPGHELLLAGVTFWPNPKGRGHLG